MPSCSTASGRSRPWEWKSGRRPSPCWTPSWAFGNSSPHGRAAAMDHADVAGAVELLRSLGEESRALLLHLFDCPRCRLEVQAELRAPGLDVDAPLATTRFLAQTILSLASKHLDARQVELRQDLQRAEQLYDELVELPPAERADAVDRERRFQTPGVARWLLEAAQEAADKNPDQSGSLAALALAVAERLGPEWAETSLESELRA